MHTTHPWPSTKIKNRDFKAIFFKIPFLKLPNLTLSFHWFLNTLNFTPSLSLRVTPVISHGSGQPLFTTPVAQVVQSKQEEAWKRTRVGGSAPLTDFPPVDPFADAPSRGPITVIHSRSTTPILLRTTGTYRRKRPNFAETPNHTFSPTPFTGSHYRPLVAGRKEGREEGGMDSRDRRETGSEREWARCEKRSTRVTVRASGVKMRRTGVAQHDRWYKGVEGRSCAPRRHAGASLFRDTSARFGNAVLRQSRSGEDAARVKRRDRQAIRREGIGIGIGM